MALLPVLFVVLRPDWYNANYGIDPYFYTGYTQNLDNSLALVGDSWYFTTRWSLYIPQRLFFLMFGARPGYLLFRFVTASIIVVCVYCCGQRWWPRRVVTSLAILACLLQPMTVRAIFTDHVETVVLPLGVLAITVISLKPFRLTATFTAGVALGLALTAQVFAGSIIATTTISAAFTCWSTWRSRLRHTMTLALGVAVSLLFGLLLFRWAYSIPNVFQPTIDFARRYTGEPDALRSTNLSWLKFKLWIYLPAFILGVAWLGAHTRMWRYSQGELFILRCCGLQYLFHWSYQFARNGVTLELPWYWSYMLPSFLLATAVVIGRVADLARGRDVWLSIGLLLLVLTLMPNPFPAARSWVVVAVLAGAAWMSAWRLRQRVPAAVVTAVVMTTTLVPPFAPRAGDEAVDNNYEAVFHATSSSGQDSFEAMTWFRKTFAVLDRGVQRDVYYWVGNGVAHPFAAMYQAHVSGHWVNAGWGLTQEERMTLSTQDLQRIRTGEIRYLALMGLPSEVTIMADHLAAADVGATTLLDAVSPSSTRTTVRIVQLAPSS
jgi:hypothetical protein